MYRRNPARLSGEGQRRFAPDLAADPYYRFLDATAFGWQVAVAAGLFACGGWSWVVWGVFVRLTATYNVTWLVNSAAHLSGFRTFRTPGKDRSTNNWWVAFLAWGEGWHNNHHAFPFSARHGLLWFEFDVTWWTIRLLKCIRLAHDVKVPESAILQRYLLRPALRQSAR
jgi:fatty-acid desaturase